MTVQPVFEQPDLRTRNAFGSGSSYQHPQTGQRVPGVTSISGLHDKSNYLVPWAMKFVAQAAVDYWDELVNLNDPDARYHFLMAKANLAKDDGRNEGSLAHNTIEQLLAGQQVEIADEIKPRIDGWKTWVDRWVAEWLEVEATVWSHTFGYAGTMDALVRLKDGRVAMVDYKTGKDVHFDAALQLTALKNADVIVSTDGERPFIKPDVCAVLHLPRPVQTKTGRESVRGKWSYREVRTELEEMQCFLALKIAYDYEHQHANAAILGKQTTPTWSAPS